MGGMEQQSIAAMLKRAENTIGAWKKEGNWEDKRRRAEVQKQTSEEAIRELIDYQLQALRELTQAWRESREPGKPPKLIEKGEIDALQKLYSSIKHSEREWEDYVFVMRDFMLWLERHKLQMAKDLTEPITFYLNDKRNG